MFVGSNWIYSAIIVCNLRFTSISIVGTHARALVSAAALSVISEIILVACEYNFYVWLKHFAQKIPACV